MVLLSIGGDTGSAMDIPANMQTQFKTDLVRVLKAYNFDGVDIDLEGDSIQKSATKERNVQLLSNILPEIYKS